MSPEAQRIAIAEACPKVAMINGGGKSVWRDAYVYSESSYSPHHEEFDPLNDLNAMHEAEKVLSTAQRIEYVREIGYIWTKRNDRAIPDWWLVHEATAPHRAEAFLRTIGKWEDGK